MENQQPEATQAAIKQLQADFNSHAETAAKELRRLHARNQELEAMLDAVGAGGVSAQRITQADARDAQRYLDYLVRNQARVLNNLDEYEGEEENADCGYWLEFTDSHSQTWAQVGFFKTPQEAIDAAIAAAKGE